MVFHYLKFGILKKLFLRVELLSDGIGIGILVVYLLGMGLFEE